MSKILNFGSLNLDYVYEVDHIIRPGETMAACSRKVFPGGKGLNQSVACAKAGAQVFQAGALGCGDNSLLLSVLKEAGVDISELRVHAEVPTGHTVIQVDKNGQNSIILFGGANQSLSREEIDETFESFGQGDWLVLQNEVNDLRYLMEKGLQNGMRIAFNVSPFSQKLLELPLDRCELLLVNEIEASGITSKPADSEPKLLLKALVEKLPSCDIVMTLGTRGSVFKAHGQKAQAFGCYQVETVDTTGSGDTYTGFLLQALMSGESIYEAMKLASCAAAISVTRHGASCSIPSLSEVLHSELFQGPPPIEPVI